MNVEKPAFIKINQLPIIGCVFRKYDLMIGEMGLQRASAEVIRRTGSRLEIVGMEDETKNILETKPVLMVCNHPHDAESLMLLGTIPERNDTYIIASHNQMGIGGNITEHIIPVYIGKQQHGDVKLSVRIARRFNVGPQFSEVESHQKNIQSIERASSLIREGHEVIIFPEGARGKEGKWLKGIGYLVKNIGELDNCYYVKVHIEGTSDLDILRLIPKVSKILNKGKIYFSKPRKITDIIVGETDPKQIAEKLEQEYKEWIIKLR